MIPFACYLDVDGNVWMTPGPVIAFHSTTTTFEIGGSGQGLVPFAGEAFHAVAGSGGGFVGGNGTNLDAEPGTPLTSGTLVPWGKFRATAEDTWTAEGNPAATVVFDSGDGSAEISDGTDVVATLPPASATIAPYGTFTATTYGEGYNGGTPWTVDIAYEGASDPFPPRLASIAWTDDATAEGGLYNRTGWQSWEAAADPSWTLTIDGTGAGEISDGTDVVATREADAERLHDPAGQWAPTSYGLATYGDPVSVPTGTASAGTWPTQAYQLTDTDGTVETWVGLDDPTKAIRFDTADGDAELWDATVGLVAERLSGVSTGHFNGTYTATAEGEDAFNGGSAFTVTVATASEGTPFFGLATLGRGVPAAGVLYVALTVDGDDEVTSATGPFWASALPANTDYDKHVAILTSNGAGLTKQVQVGAIYWKPGLPGPDGTGLTWVSLTAAAYAALGTPDPDTIYDITDYP